MGKRQSPLQVVLGKLDHHMEINEIRTHSHTIHNNELKIFKDLNPNITPYSVLEEIIGKSFWTINHTSVPLGQFPKTIERNRVSLVVQW